MEDPAMKRLFAATATLALAASVVLTPPVAAGGWASVSVVGPSSAPVAGAPWPLELEVLQHGVTPIDWETVSLVARHQANGMVTAANGRPGDAVGRYLFDVVFPDAGDWTLEFGLHQLAMTTADPTTVSVGESSKDQAGGPVTIDVDALECD
jgi:hypothetical protein